MEGAVVLNGRTQVLLVDDNVDMLSIVSRWLREAGYEVLEAATGSACWELAQTRQPDLILLDVHLPDVNGIEVCRRLKADPQLSKILVAHLSGTETSNESQVAGLEAGADAYIVYPLSRRELLARVGALARLAWAEKRSAAFARLGRQLSVATTPEEAARVIVGVAQDLLGWDACFVDLYSLETDTVTPLLRMDNVNGQHVSFDPDPPGLPPRPISRRAIEWGGQLILRDDSHTPPVDLQPFGDVQRRSLSLMFVPIRDGHQVTGVLSIQSYTPRAYTPDDLNTLQALADHCGGALARLASEHAQREADRRLREMLETVQLIALGLDADGNVTFCNDYLLNLLGYQREELLGRNWFEACLPPPARVSAKQAFKESLRAGVIASRSENEILTRAGERRLIAWTNTAQRDLQGNIIGVSSLGEDVTERKRAEQVQTVLYRIADAAHQSVRMDYLYRFIHQELSGILDTQNFYIALYDAERNLISFPYYVDENYAESPSPTALERTPRRGLTEYVLRRGQALFAYEQDLRDLADAGEIELIGTLARVWLGAPLKSGDKIIGVLAVQSYTHPAAYTPKDLELLEFIASQIGSAIERKRAEEALRETNRRLEQALAELQRTQQHVIQQERLRAIGTMASGIAHDFNNALSPILGYSELLLAHPNDLGDRERIKRYLERINVAAQDAAHVVSRLREFYRHRDDGEVVLPVHINQVVEQTLSLTQPKWKNEAQAKGIAIQIETDLRPVPTVMGNEADLREMLTNLIFNAVDAMPNGGTITIRTYEHQEDAAPTEPPNRCPPPCVILSISDTGMGMSEEVRQRCIEPFFTTKGKRGTGMGLAMVYGIVQRHEGTMEIESALGQGTTVTVRLPVQPEHSPGQKSSTPDCPMRPLHVLLIEDEPRVCEVIAEYLRGDGHTVEVAHNGLEALQKFEVNRFDLILTDRAMPAMSGDHVAAAIKQMQPHAPVIMLTGFGDLMNSAGECPFGVDLIVSKPLTITKLRQAIAQVARQEKIGKI